MLYSFTGLSDGSIPTANVALGVGGVLYGVTEYGGLSGTGVIFSLTPPASAGPWTESVLYSFTGLTDGGWPIAGLAASSSGTLYGNTCCGGTANSGTTFLLQPASFNLSGQVTFNSSGLGGVTLTLSGSLSSVTSTDSNGNYSFAVQAGGSYTVTPSLNGFSFTPPAATFNNLSSDQTANFVATQMVATVTISGQVTLNGNGLPGVTMTPSWQQTPVTTDSSGNYTFTVPAGGNYTVTPSLSGYTFNPPSATFLNISTNQVANFSATLIIVQYTISGQVTLYGNGLSGVLMTLTGTESATTTTDGSGNYSFTVTTGNYTVTPPAAGYIFTPRSQTFDNLNASQTANFTAVVYSDFNQDGHPDVIWQNPANGAAQIWYLGGTQGVTVLSAASLTAANTWRIVAIADFDGNGTPDLVWQDPVHGGVQVWLMGGVGGTTILSAANITSANPWHVVSAADFNQDGHPDLLWQDPVSGAAQIWYLGGAQGVTLLGAANVENGNAWHIVGTGDFDGNGFPDVVWQDPVSGTVQVWFMGGTTPGQEGSQVLSAADLTANPWSVVSIAGFEEGNHPDVVFQDPASGASQVFFYTGDQGTTFAGSAVLSGPNTWRIAGPH